MRSDGTDASVRFTAAVSHELRTPLNGILGMAALLRETGLDSAQREYVAAIERSGAGLLRMLDNVLDHSRLQSGGIPLDRVRFDPSAVMQEVVELIAPEAHAKGLDLAARCDLPGSCTGDPGRLRQILFNLVGNAVKFTDRGAILLEVSTAPEGGARFSVRDTGPGIDAKARETLFEAYTQLRAADAHRGAGVGLGLSIVAGLCRSMGGAITIDGAPGHGACFHVDLPLRSVSADRSSPPPDRFAPGRILSLQTPPATTLAILSALGDSGMRLAHHPDDKADIAIVDAALPPACIRGVAAGSPCLAVLRPEDRSRLASFTALGARGYLIRPLRRATLVDQVRRLLRGADLLAPEPAAGRRPGVDGRILVADDNPVNALLARRALEADGYEVDAVATGSEAVEAVGGARYRIVFMDVRMPVMDGLEATRRIRALEAPASEVPIVAVTADLDPGLEARARAAGVSRLASKPIDPDRLRALAEAAAGGGASAG